MHRSTLLPLVLCSLAAAQPAAAQALLRAAPSGRATTQVTLAPPRPAAAMGTMPGMTAGAGAAPAQPAAAPAQKPTVIRVEYGQPHLRGRTLHTDSLVPYDRPWRTGANNATTLTTDVDLVVGGSPIAKGSYVLYTIPRRAGWTLVVQKSAGQSAMQYSDSLDVARIDLRHTTLQAPLESLTMWLIPSTDTTGPARGELRFAWGSDQLSTDWVVR